MTHITLSPLSAEKEQLLTDYQEYLQRWQYYLAKEKLRAARYFLTLGPESLSKLRDADVEHYAQNRCGPLSYYLRTFQFFLRQRGLTQAPEPDLLTPRLAGMPTSTARQVRVYLETLQRRNYSPATIESIMYLLTAFIQALPPEQQARLSLVDRNNISAYIDRLQARSLKGATINNHLSAICGFFRFLLDQEQVERNPVMEKTFDVRPPILEDTRYQVQVEPVDPLPFYLLVIENNQLANAKVRQLARHLGSQVTHTYHAHCERR